MGALALTHHGTHLVDEAGIEAYIAEALRDRQASVIVSFSISSSVVRVSKCHVP